MEETAHNNLETHQREYRQHNAQALGSRLHDESVVAILRIDKGTSNNIGDSLTQEEAARLEIKLIAKYQTQDPDKGYNIASGGCINSGWHLSAEQKERLSTSQKGRVFSEETRAKLREAWKTRTVSPETRTKQSRMRKGTCMGGSHHHARAVICVETGEVFPAIADAERAKGVFSESIGRAARNGGDHTAGGYHWRYADEAVISHA